MLVNVDGKAIEWIVASYLSQDPVALQEIHDNIDQHTANQIRFGLPSRHIAKIFIFRLLYGGSAYSYANDPDFSGVSNKEKFWQQVIDEFYNKYQGIAKWHNKLMEDATSNGKLVMPTGREYPFEPTQKGMNLEWPRTKILNYPVQGCASDLIAIARVSYFKRHKKANLKSRLISTIHDSIVVDCPQEEVDIVVKLFQDVFDDVPKNFERLFGVPFNLPTRCEISVGPTKYDLTEV